METRENYQKADEMAEKYNKLVELYDRLIEAGVPKKHVHYYQTPSVSSSYSMGERLIILCHDEDIEKVDNRKHYRGEYKGRETHGRVVLNMKKKDLREYVELCRRISLHQGLDRDEIKKRIELCSLRTAIVRKSYDEKASIVKKFVAY